MQNTVRQEQLDSEKAQNNLDQPKLRTGASKNYDYFIPEARKLIKQGNYKKAFRLIDEYYTDTRKLGTAIRIRMCRRILVSIVSLSERSLAKSEIQKPEKLSKLLEVGNYYLEQWHSNLVQFISKTNPKLNIAPGVLEELSASGVNSSKSSRRNSKNLSKSDITLPKYAPIKRKSILIQIMKSEGKDQPEGLLDTSIDEDDDNANEVISPKDLNANFYLDEFFCYFLLNMMNWGLFQKKMKNWNTSYRYFVFCLQCSKKFESSVNLKLLRTVTKVRIPLASFYMEYERYKDAQDVLDGALSILQTDLTMHYATIQDPKNYNSTLMARKSARLLATVLMLFGKNYELQDNYIKTIESYKVASWLCKKFLQSDDELTKKVQKLYSRSKNEYGSYLEEIGEMERVVFENKMAPLQKQTVNSTAERDTNFEKLQEALYKKFDHSSLNRMRLPIRLNLNSLATKTTPDEGSEILQDGVNSKTSRNVQGEARSSAELDLINNHHLLQKLNQKNKKTEPKKFTFSGEAWNQVPSEKWKLVEKNEYSDEVNIEKKITNIKLTEQEEKRYLNMLNRNIRNNRLLTGASTARSDRMSSEYTDIDNFFQKQITSRIEKDQEERDKPEDFNRIVKGYAHFIKTEEFDQKEFKFGDKMVNLKQRENLGESPEPSKYRDPVSLSTRHARGPQYAREKRNVETLAYFIHTQTQVENTIQTRFNLSKVFNKLTPQRPHHAKSSSLFTPSKRLASEPGSSTLTRSPRKSNRADSADVEEEINTEEKPKLSDLIFKHRISLKLKTVANVVKEHSRRLNKASQERQTASTIATDAGEEEAEPKINDHTWKKMSTMVKDRITSLMEDIQSDLKCDNFIKKRLQTNQPIKQEEIVSERFLKNLDDLASSTRLLSVKRDATKKNLDFAEIVRLQSTLRAEEKRKARLTRRKTVTPQKRAVRSSRETPQYSISVPKNE